VLYQEVRRLQNQREQQESSTISEQSGCETDNDETLFYCFDNSAVSTNSVSALSEADLF